MFNIGVAKTDITPQPGIPLAGYRERAGSAEGMHDPLFARALAFESSTGGLIMIALDVLAVDDDLVAAIRREVTSRMEEVPAARVVICATHTHSGPSGIFATLEDYDRILAGEIACKSARAAVAAWESRRPGRLGAGACKINGVASNREDPARVFDPVLRVLKLEDVRGNPIACVFNYACHPTVLDPKNLLFSRDWPGYTVDVMEASEGTVGMAMFVNGAAADVSTRYTRNASSFDEAERLGRIVAEGALSLAGGIECTATPEISVSRSMLMLPRRRPVSLESARSALELARREVDSLRACGNASPGDIKRAESVVLAWQVVLDRQRDLSADPPCEDNRDTAALDRHVMTDISIVDFKDAVIVFLPGEVSAETGMRIRQRVAGVRRSDVDRVWLVGYANGHIGYVVRPDVCGVASYEAVISRVGPEAADLIEEEVSKLAMKGMSGEC